MKNIIIILQLFIIYCLGEIVDIASDFDFNFSGTSGWSGGSNTSVQKCIFGNIFGSFGSPTGANIGKQFTGLPPHYSLTVSIIYFPLWSWDKEYMIVLIDGTEYFKRSIDFYLDLYQDSICNYSGASVFYHYKTAPIPLSFNITHTQTSVQVNFKSTTNQVWYDEAMGLSKFYLSVDTCHYTCASCNGPSENQCLTCPTGSTKTGSTCKCNSGSTSINYQCQSTCSAGYTHDTILRRCVEDCPINNCQSCNEKKCISCSSGFYLLNGQCTDRCPWYTSQSGNNCVDNDYNAIPRPYVLAEDMVNKEFNHAYVQSKGWQYKKFQTYNSQQVSNLVSSTCNGLSMVGGFNFLPFNDTCSTGCGITNSFTNLPPHHKLQIKYQIWRGDTWDTEPYYTKIDGTEIFRDVYRFESTTKAFVCGRSRTDGGNPIKNLANTFSHTSSSVNVELGFVLDQLQWDEWGAHREVQILLHLCENVNCSACNTSGMSCTACIGSTGQTTSRVGSQCQCPTGFHDIGAAECCKTNVCGSCSNDTQCDTCIGSTGQASSRLLNSLCICPDKYFDNYPTQDECQQCDHQCATCSGSSNNCSLCIVGSFRNAKPNCQCQDGYYEGNDLNCYKCDYQCSKCTGSADNCIECKGTNRSNSFPDCLCNDNYFDDGSNANCVACIHPCINCKSLTQCDSCVSGPNRNTFPSCTCLSGYYEDSSKNCQKCDHNCNTCIDSSDKCTECKGANRSTSFPECVCNQGYFDDGINSDCVKCEHPCVNCTALDQCTSCVSGSNRLSAPSTCECISHFYENGSQQCVECDYNCGECIDTSDKCTSCQGTNRSNSFPNCLCNNNYFDDGSNANCVACIHPCVNCKSLTQCDSCVSGPNRNTFPSCTCLSGYFEDSNKDCLKCDHNCNTCIDSQDNCTECKGSNRLTDFPECLCETGYYDDGTNSNCVQCPTGCSTCDDQNTCTECKDSYYKDGNSCLKCPLKYSKCSNATTGIECAVGTGRTGLTPDCGCNDTFFDNNTNSNNCEVCVHPCVNCTGTNDNCTSCHPAANRNDINDCTCQTGYFEETDLTCLICTSPCLTCETSTTNCTECINTQNRQLKPSCLCIANYFENQSQICEVCQHPCKECTGTALTCDECVPGSNRIQDSTCKCEDGFYDDGTLCQQCDLTKCQTCENSPTECIICADDTRGGEDCHCRIGFFEQGVAACGTCDYQCQKCSGSSDSCDTCSDSNRDINNDCKCIDTFFNDGVNPICVACSYPCINCTSQYVCLTCVGLERVIPNCSCSDGYFDNQEPDCQQCAPQCKLCQNDKDQCITCNRGFQRSMQAPSCGCREGFYEEAEDILDCKQCFIGCKRCEQYTGICLECNVPTFSTLNCQEESNGSFLSFETISDSNNLSLEVQVKGTCENQCLTCQDTSSNCTSCKIGLNRQNSPPNCSCQTGYHDSNFTTDDCQKCPKTCLQCISSTVCTQCNEVLNRELNKQIMQCVCMKGYTELNQGDNKCVPCFTYQGKCFQECPKNTIQDDSKKICSSITLNSQSNSDILIICAGLFILFQVLIFLVIKYFTKKNINQLQKFSQPAKFDKLSQQQDNSSIA